MEWSNEKCVALIHEYEKYPTLWNPKHATYYNRNKKHDAWVDVVNVIGFPVEEAKKKKMESLLRSYRRERAKAKSSMGAGKGM
ncbi:hypothetical protein PR048_006019 [Dryococelus australis]|uniref:MADF domain-containing protein n=1 Tax=Dryococelus australis TaxID=614101 RepID=A0ABQ9I9V0_9NEOP|nr:hypothetical protein PR048_006019 [Dryococelus australis]